MDKQKQIEEMAKVLYAPLNSKKRYSKYGELCVGCYRWYEDIPCKEKVQCNRYKKFAEALVNKGYGDTKQAVREFAERLKEYCQEQFDRLEKLADFSDDARLSMEFIRRRDEVHNIRIKIDELVKEVCGE